MVSPIARLSTWYRAPEQELFGREAGWMGRWFMHWQGLLLLASIMFFRFVGASARPMVFDPGASGSSIWSMAGVFCAWLSSLIVFVAWIVVIQTRSTRLLRKNRLEELLVTPIRADQLFPALAAAPLVALVVLDGLGTISHTSAAILAVSRSTDFLDQIREALVGQNVNIPRQVMIVGWLVFPVVAYFGQLVVNGAVTFYCLWRMIPNNGYLRIVFHLVVGWIIVMIPGVLIMMSFMFFSFLGVPTLAGRFTIFAIPVLQWLVTLLCAIWLGRLAYRKLHSPNLILRLQKAMEKK